MKTITNIVQSALIVSAFFVLTQNSFGQKQVELLPGSERGIVDDINGTMTLVGNVSFLYQGNKMYCDSAIYFEKKDYVKAFGNVHINKKDTLNLFCDSLHYNGKKGIADLYGNVRVRDNEYKLTTDILHYDTDKSQAFYVNGGKVESILNNEVLTSKIGYFHPDSKNFYFAKNVNYKGKELMMKTDTLRYLYSQNKAFFYGATDIQMDSTDIYCESGWYNTTTQEGELTGNAKIFRPKEFISGDTLIYQPKKRYSEGIGNVYYHDSLQKMWFEGNYALLNDSLGYNYVTGNALAHKSMDNDTLSIHADTLYSFKQDSIEFVKAYRGAKIYSRQFQAIADSMIFAPNKKKLELHREPVAWSNGAELKGNFMDIDIDDTIIQQVNIYENSTILMEVEKDSFYNQIGGKNIVALFSNNKIRRANVSGNAMTVFFPEEKDSTDTSVVIKRMGMNRLYASDLRIDIDSNEIQGITYIETPDGVFYPMNQIKKEEQFIPNFNWKGALKPKSRVKMTEE